ncbi:DUF4352 domain-containing protein [Microbacterium sp. Clip185]|uniref:DUF4352 domain-containing protein n=1 Tax=Microbacterium sp. Clip185 TaxID=3025663 RepID=UPI002366B0C6|nr:DUF4352 domain-containing protein [Microbacterium sp. Clip185]WDG17492.1 DUF4352 domain-containing protein [Microbacterium sp. Clip185]
MTVTVTETVTATPTTPAVAAPLAMGATAQFSTFSATVHSVQLESAPNAPAPQSAGNHWASVEVEGCNTGSQPFPVSGGPWQLVADDNRTFTMSSTGYSQFPEPDYGFGSGTLNPGECKRGWITFVVNDGAQITTVRYQNDLGEGARWAL